MDHLLLIKVAKLLPSTSPALLLLDYSINVGEFANGERANVAKDRRQAQSPSDIKSLENIINLRGTINHHTAEIESIIASL
jgi:hypothetical protein